MQHALVAGDGGHRRQRVHALRARDARHELHREQPSTPAAASARMASGAPSGSAKPITTCPLPKPARVRRDRPHLQHDVGRREHGVARRDRRARLLVGRRRKSRCDAGVVLDEDVEAALLQAPRRRTESGRRRRSPGHVSRGTPTFMPASLQLLDPLGDGRARPSALTVFAVRLRERMGDAGESSSAPRRPSCAPAPVRQAVGFGWAGCS